MSGLEKTNGRLASMGALIHIPIPVAPSVAVIDVRAGLEILGEQASQSLCFGVITPLIRAAGACGYPSCAKRRNGL